MNKNSFYVKLEAALDKIKSRNNIKNDIKSIEPQLPKIKLQSRIDTSTAKKELNSNLKSANSTVTVNTDTTQAKKEIDKLSEQKTETSVQPVIKTSPFLSSLKKTQEETSNFLDKFTKSAIGTNLMRISVQNLTNAISNAIMGLKELDSIKTNIQSKTGFSDFKVDSMMDSYHQTAKNLSSTTKEIANTADEIIGMGTNISDVNKLVESSQILSKIGIIDSANAANYLISSMKGYQIEAENSITIIDKLVSANAKSIVSTGELAEALSLCASYANNSGISLDRLIGYISVVGENSQKSISELGNSFRSIFSRINNIKLNKLIDDDTGESLSNIEDNLKKLGIQLRDIKGNYKDFDVVLDDIGNHWKNFTSAEQNAVSTTLAGTNQSGIFESLMNHYTQAVSLSETISTSAGTALEHYGIYQDSISAKANELTSSIETLASNIMSENLFKGIIEATTGLVEFIDKTNILKGVLAGFVTMGIGRVFVSIGAAMVSTTQTATGLITAFSLLKKATTRADFEAAGKACIGLNDKQLQLVLSTKGLEDEQRRYILTGKGVKESEVNTTLATLGFSNAQVVATKTTFSFRGALEALKTTFAMNPVGTIITIISSITTLAAIVFPIFKQFSKTSDTLKENFQNAKDEIDNINSSFEDTKSKTEEIAEEYAKLAQGVDLLNNKNKSLSTEEYKRFLELSNQLSSLYPSLTKSYDENGNAILNLSGNINTITESLQNLISVQRSLANQEIIKNIPDLYSGYYNNISNSNQEINTAAKKQTELKKAYDFLNKNSERVFYVAGAVDSIYGKTYTIGNYANALDTFGIKYKEVTMNDNQHKMLDINDEDFSKLHDIYITKYNQLRQDIEYIEQKTESERASFNQYLNTWLQEETLYNQIENIELQQFIQETLFNLDLRLIPKDIDKTDWNEVSDYFRKNILFSISNINDKEVSEALSDIFSNSLSPGQLLNSISKVQEYFGKTHPISISLQSKTDNINPLINNVKEKLQFRFTDKVEELSLENLKIAADLEIPDNTFLSWDELLEKIYETTSSLLPLEKKLSELTVKYNNFKNSRNQNELLLNYIAIHGNTLSGNVNLATAPAAINNDGTYYTNSSLSKEGWYGDKETGSYRIIHYTPILPDGSILDEYSLNQYISKILNSQDPLESDKIENGGLGIVYKIDTKINKEKITDENLEQAFEKAEKWDAEMHNLQASLYKNEIKILADIEKTKSRINKIINPDEKTENLFGINFSATDLSNNNIIDDFQEKISSLADTYSKLSNGNYSSSELLELLQQLSKNGADFSSIESFEQLGNVINDLKTDSIDNLISQLNIEPDSGLASYLASIADEAINVKSALEGVTNSLNDIQNSYSTVTNALKEYNENGYLTINTLNSILTLEPKYLSCLQTENGQLTVNKTAYENLTKAQVNKAKQAVINEAVVRFNQLAYESLSTSTEKADVSENKFIEKIKTGIKNLKSYAQNIWNTISAKLGFSKANAADNYAKTLTDTSGNISESEIKLKQEEAKKAYEQALKINEEASNEIWSDMNTKLSFIENFEKNIGTAIESNTSSNSSSSISSVSSPSSEKSTAETFNWIETKITCLTEAIDKLKTKADNTYTSWTARNTALSETISKTQDAIALQQQAYERYMQQADSVGLSNHYKNLVQNGAMDISSLSDETLKNQINEYQSWYEKAQQCLKTQENLNAEINSFQNQKFDHIKSEYDAVINRMQSAYSFLESQITLLSSSSDYNSLRTKQTSIISQLESERNALQNTLNSSGILIYTEEWYQLISQLDELDQQILDAKNTLKEIDTLQFDHLKEAFDFDTSVLEHGLQMLQNQTDLLELRGQFAKESYYTGMISYTQKQLDALVSERSQLQTMLEHTLYTQGTAEWNDMYTSLMEIDEEIASMTNNLTEFQNSIRDLNWEIFEYLEESLNRITDETDYLIELLSKKELYNSETGAPTEYASAALGLHAAAYDIYKQQAKDYFEEVLDLQSQLSNGAGKDVLEQYHAMQDAHRDAVLAAEEEKEAILDLIEEGYQAQLDALQSLIDKKKEQMQAEKNLYDYQKSIKQHTDTISSLEKQQLAYENDNSEEAMSKIQQIRTELEKAKEELAETEYEQYLSDTETMLEQLASDYEAWMNERLDHSDALLNDIIGQINTQGSAIMDTLNSVGAEYGTTISDSITSIFHSESPFTSALTNGFSNVTTGISGIAGTTSAINELLKKVADITGTIAANTNAGSNTSKKPSENNNNNNNVVTPAPAPSAPVTKPVVQTSTNTNTSTSAAPVSGRSLLDKLLIDKYDGYPKSKLSINTSIVDRLKYNNKDSSWQARSIYWSRLFPEGGPYIGSASQNTRLLNYLKGNGYADGTSQVGRSGYYWTQENGCEIILRRRDGAILTPLSKGDAVLNKNATQNFYDMFNHPQLFKQRLDTGANAFDTLPNYLGSINDNRRQDVNVGDIHVTIDLPNVKNYLEFRNNLVRDKDFENSMCVMINNAMLGKSTIEKLKYCRG